MADCVILSSDDDEPEIIEIRNSQDLKLNNSANGDIKTNTAVNKSARPPLEVALAKNGVTLETDPLLIPIKSSAPPRTPNKLPVNSLNSVKNVKTQDKNEVSIVLSNRVSRPHIDQNSPGTSELLSKARSKPISSVPVKTSPAPVMDSHTAGASCSQKQQSVSKGENKGKKAALDDPVLISREENEVKGLIKKLLGICDEVNKNDNFTSIKNRLWRYHSEASPEFLCSSGFKSMLKTEIQKCTSKEVKHHPFISLKKVLEALKANPYLATKKLRKLQRMLEKVQKMIAKLEATEVSSDEENNVYIQLDRWNKRAVQIYEKICELMDKPADADRQYLRKVSFSGSGTNQIICRALEKFFNKTRKFPDFFDVKTLVSATNEKESLGLSPAQIHSTAEKIFLEFGTMLQRRRCYDDYSIMVEYVNEDSRDPALEDLELMRKLNENKKLYHGRENKVLEEYTIKDLERKKKVSLKGAVDNDQSKKQEHDENEIERDDDSGDDCSSDESENERVEEEELGRLKSETSEEEHSAHEEESVGSSSSSDNESSVPKKRIKLDSPSILPDKVKKEEVCNSPTDEGKDKSSAVKNVSKVIEEELVEDSKHPDIEIIETFDKSNTSQLKSSEQNDSGNSSLNKCFKNVDKTPKLETPMVIDLEDNFIDLTSEEKLPYSTPSAEVEISSTSGFKLNSNTSFSGERKCVPIVFEGRHPLIITEQSTIFISRGAKIFKRLEKPVINDVITID